MSDSAHFIGRLLLEDLVEGRFLLAEPLGFYSAELKAVVQAPAGTITDLASIPPWVPGVLVPKLGNYDYPAVIHDAAYNDELQDASGNVLLVSKETADDLFKEGMEARGVGTFRRNAMWLMVHWFGRGQFNKRKRPTTEAVW